MKSKSKRIIAAVVAIIVVLGGGVGIYAATSGTSFNPDGYAKAGELNANRISFDSDSKYTETDKNSSGESDLLQKDSTADEKLNSNGEQQSPVLFETDVLQSNGVPSDNTVYDNEDINGDLSDAIVQNGDSSNGTVLVDDPDQADTIISVPGTSGGSRGTSGSSAGGSGSSSGSTSNTGSSDNNSAGSGSGDSENTNNSGSTDNSGGSSGNTDNNDNNNSNNNDDNNGSSVTPVYTDSEPTLPSDIYDGIINVKDYPEDGISSDEQVTFMMFSADSGYDSSFLYYGEKLDDWKLLCSSFAYVYEGENIYRLTSYSENFKVGEYPETATENFTATFYFRQNSTAEWQTAEVEFEVKPYKIVALNSSLESAVNPVSTQYLNEGESVSLLGFYDDMLSDHYSSTCTNGTELSEIFLGWSETEGGEAIEYTYTPTEKGLCVLYPLGFKKLDEEYTATLVMDFSDGIRYFQTLTGYSGESQSLEIPDGLQAADFEGEFTSIAIPESLLSIGDSLNAAEEYTVSDDNTVFSATDGILYNKDKTSILKIPTSYKTLSVSSGVTSITLSEDNSLKTLYLESENTPEIDLSLLSGAMIYVPEEYYSSYFAVWGTSLGDNKLVYEGMTSEAYDLDGSVLQNDGSNITLLSIDSEVCGIYAIPDGVTKISENALSECSGLTTLIIPESVNEIEENALAGIDGLQLYFVGSSPCKLDDNAFGESSGISATVLESSLELYSNEWQALGLDITGEEMSLVTEGGCRYLIEPDGATLLKVSNDITRFDSSVTGDIDVKAIGSGAFYSCKNLISIELSESVKKIWSGALYGCEKLEAFLSDSTDSFFVGDGVFEDAAALRYVAFNAQSAEFENDYTLWINDYCYPFAPVSGEGYGDDLFFRCAESYFAVNENDYDLLYCDADATYETGEGSYILLSATTNVSGEVSFFDNTISVFMSAFSNCTNEFTLSPESTENILYYEDSCFTGSGISGEIVLSPDTRYLGASTFLNCNKITGVCLDGLEMFPYIYDDTFSGCTSLASVTYGDSFSAISIGMSAFAQTAIEEITIPECVSTLGTGIFYECPNLKTITLESEIPPSLYCYTPGYEFELGCDAQLIVPESAKADYLEAWKYSYMGYSTYDEWYWDVWFEMVFDGATDEEIQAETDRRVNELYEELKVILKIDE